jgi:hypothetical protein
MMRVLVTYKVKADRVAENEELVRAVYAELHAIGDPDIHYATFKKEDGVSFVHFASFPSKEKQAILSGCAAFQADLKDRCEIPPSPAPLTEVGSVNFV